MDDEKIYLLLRVTKKSGNINPLLRAGLVFRDIGDLIEVGIKNNLIEFNKNRLALTPTGIIRLEGLEKIFKKRNKKEWIEAEYSSRIQKLPEDFIYLPDQSDLFFLI